MMRVRGRSACPTRTLVVLIGAMVPGAATVAEEPTFTTRDELVRKWDLNKDGAIDEGEVELARSKMRRERTELQMQSGIDPLTGRPRLTPEEEAAVADAEPALELPEAERPRPKQGSRDAGLPGTRPPDVLPPIPATRTAPAAAGPQAAGSRSPAAGEADARAGAGAPAPRRGPGTVRGPAGGEDRGIVTGGARAGGVARPGYGATLPKPDLNAGRLPAGLPGRRPAPASGGLLPNLRTRPTVPAPPSTAPARRTVEDYDVY